MAALGHGEWWLLLAVGAVAAIVATRSRVRFTRTAQAHSRSWYPIEVLRVWIVLVAAAIAGFVILENAVSVLSTGGLVELAPVALVTHIAALGPVALAVGCLALGVVAIVHVGRTEYAKVLNAPYASLTADGAFTPAFEQSPWAVAFVRDLARQAARLRGVGVDAEVRVEQEGRKRALVARRA
jgi:hypothetical protein